MSEPQMWRELLAEIIENPQERERIAAALSVNPLTLMRWIRNEATPRASHMKRLLEVIPKLRPLPAEAPPSAISITFYNHVLGLYGTVPDHQRFLSICTAVLQDAVQHLASSGVDLDISVVQCLAPSQGNIVRCLREHVGLGTTGLNFPAELRKRLFGSESLAGYVVECCRLAVIADLSEEQRFPHQLPEQARSGAAFPILHAGRIAGCLLVASTKPDYFGSPAPLNLLQTYATLLALAFDPEDFYEPHSIKLGIMPSLQVQDSYLVTFQQRVYSVVKKAIADQHPLNYHQAEQHVWWQIAEELLQLSLRLSPEA